MASFRAGLLVLAVFAVSVYSSPIPEGAGTKTGALGGALLGGAAGGKLGAVVGAGAGALAGHELHKANKNANEAKAAAGAPTAAFEEDSAAARSSRVKREGAGTKTGAAVGAVAGGVVAGPLGAAVGAGAGALAGHELHSANKHANEAKAASGVPVAAFADDRSKRDVEGAATGALGGAAVGAVAGGPIGAAVGAAAGGLAGHEIQKANQNANQAKEASGLPVASLVEEYDFSSRVRRSGPGTKTGAAVGAVAGGVVAGPLGAAVGAGVGALAGHELHKANKHADQAQVQTAVNSGQPVVLQQA